jgi:hypothetical protein
LQQNGTAISSGPSTNTSPNHLCSGNLLCARTYVVPAWDKPAKHDKVH